MVKSHEVLESTRGHITIRLSNGRVVRFNGEWHRPVPNSPGFVLYRSDIVDVAAGLQLSGESLESVLVAFREVATERHWPFEIA